MKNEKKLKGAMILMGKENGNYDGHSHVFSADLPLSNSRCYKPKHNAIFDDYLQHLKRHKLDGAILVQPSFLGTDNSYLLKTLQLAKQHTNMTFRGTVVLDPNKPISNLLELQECGVIGIRINIVSNKFNFNFENWINLIRKIDDIGWHVEIHCEGCRLPKILSSLLKVSQKIVIDHFGLPNQKDHLNCASQKAILQAPKNQIFVKTSAPYRVFPTDTSDSAAKKCAPIVKQLFEHFGDERLIFGSDWPWTRFENQHNFTNILKWQQHWLEYL